MKIEWTDNALDHLWAIHDYFARISPEYAISVIDRLTRRSQQIGEFPLSGRVVPEFNAKQVREVIEGAYRIIYHIRPNQIDVVALIHSSQRAPFSY